MHHTTQTSTDSSCACTALRKASRAVTRLYDDALAHSGMSIVQFSILRNLSREGAMPLMQLAELLVMERTTLYRALEPLERAGWVSISDGAGRAKTAALSTRGRQALSGATPAWADAQQRLLEAVGQKDWLSIERMLARLVIATQGLLP